MRSHKLIIPLLAVLSGCNMFASLGVQARATANTLGKRNIDFDRPAPAAKDLEQIHTVAVRPLRGKQGDAQLISGHLSTYLSESDRFTLVTPDALKAAIAPPEVTEEATETTEATEATEATETTEKPESPTGLAAIEGDVVKSGYTERIDSKRSKCGENKTCTTKTRIGTAAVSVSFTFVNAVTGEVLLQKTVEDRQERTTSATDNTPPSIDGPALLDEASKKVAGDFFAAVSPHIVQETVFFETHAKAKSLKEGANRAMGGDLEGAIEAFEQGLAQAKAKRDDKAIAKARYDLGLALVIAGDHEKGIGLLQKAQRPKSKKAWAKVILDAKQWGADAEQAKRQWAVRGGDAPELHPEVRASEGATKKGSSAVKALRAAAGR